MELLLAYVAGLLTLINPCVLPVLPIVIATALQASPRGPLALAAGMSLSFVAFGVLITAFGHLVGLDQYVLSQIGAGMMIVFGVALLLPQANRIMANATAGLAASADAQMNQIDQFSLKGQFLGGMLLGLVWSPCIGPTLGAAISLASQGESLGWVTLIMTAFALGVSTLILGLGYGTRGVAGRYTAKLRKIMPSARIILGVTFIAVGLAILLGLHHVIEGWAVRNLPSWLIDLSVSV